ncbi:type IX secretion system sortase PorU [Hymenobacter psychrophilus]|uniref:Por secretion system C-terminal sorting domain-containing protein n=1 Tax=Hymenobacter psychrophilus TaxID=651662 RepID=A0A1H3K8F3_9BACT|nr:type IX secretion system sortase PorU [Hymenobacter psychrophilus]SDY48507.1 Por secretion system C-terminal sorting domain-containing protein [Hymenobacter psychrophilus]
MRYSTFWLLTTLLLLGVSAPRAQAQKGEQTYQGRITWTGTVPVGLKGQKRLVPAFRGAAFGPEEQVGTLLVRLPGTVAAGQLVETQYEPLLPAQAGQLDLAALPPSPLVQLVPGTEARQPVTLLRLQPLRRNPQTGQAERLVRFAYTYSSASNRPGATRTYARTSVLSQGEWFKIGVPTSGIFKLDKATLKSFGLENFDPTRLRLFGNAMGTLPQPNSAYRPDDLVENDIQFVGNTNATFDNDEYFLFYARGPHTWSREGFSTRFRHQLNPYTDTAYYFLTVGPTAGRRVAPAPAVSGTPGARISTFNDRQFYERDLLNLKKTGRTWVGEAFSGRPEQTFTLPVTDLVPGSTALITSAVVAASTAATVFQPSVNGQALAAQVVPGFSCSGGSYCYPEAANTNRSVLPYQVPATSPTELKITLSYSSGSDPGAQGYLDYLEVNARRQLRLNGGQLQFRSLDNLLPGAISQFDVANAAAATIWDVSNPRRPAAVAAANGTFLARTDTVREFVAFTGAEFPAPRGFGKVASQNLHALNLDGRLELLIVAHPRFLREANKLAAHRSSHDGLNVQVVNVRQIYNEFGSGGQDVTAIRDLMKMVYDRNTSGRRQYLLLFGDASYDYKAGPTNDPTKLPDWWSSRQPANANQTNQNFVPVYESEESFDLVMGNRPNGQGLTYSSDDYYGLLDDSEGAWLPGSSNELLDVAVGRLPVSTDEQAARVTQKLIDYDSPVGYGKWRNRLTFVADDGDNNLFVYYSEQLANPLDTLAASRGYNTYKLYLDLFPQVSLAAGERSPVAEKAIDEAFEQGSLLINYIGHGGPKTLAQEQIVTNASILRLKNATRPTFMFTGTCDFSTYDDPSLTSAGEQALIDVQGGAIGLLTTTRVVYADRNQALAVEFFKDFFQRRPDGTMPRIGDVCQTAKNIAVIGDNNRNYALLGDPSMRLAYPEQTVALTEIDGKPVTASMPDTLKALQQVTLKGEVRNNGQLNTAFAGTANVQVFEKKSTVSTLGNEVQPDGSDKPQAIQLRENILYDGPASVQGGRFSLQFVVPKDINYSVGLGKISLYAADPTTRTDAQGQRLVPIGDVAPLTARDTIAPRIRLFMDNEQFVSGGLTGMSPTLLAVLRDASGINTAGTGIGHDLTLTLDGDASKVLVLNSSYTAKTDSFQVGRVQYQLKDLTPGPHELRLKAWDTWNNSAEQRLEFIAASTDKLALQHVLNYPNPFAQSTTFHFDHNRSGQDLDIQVQIFTVAGRLVRTLQGTALGSGSHVAALSWDGRDEYQDQLARGVYVYRVTVRTRSASDTGTSTASKYEKLVLLN